MPIHTSRPSCESNCEVIGSKGAYPVMRFIVKMKEVQSITHSGIPKPQTWVRKKRIDAEPGTGSTSTMF